MLPKSNETSLPHRKGLFHLNMSVFSLFLVVRVWTFIETIEWWPKCQMLLFGNAGLLFFGQFDQFSCCCHIATFGDLDWKPCTELSFMNYWKWFLRSCSLHYKKSNFNPLLLPRKSILNTKVAFWQRGPRCFLATRGHTWNFLVIAKFKVLNMI